MKITWIAEYTLDVMNEEVKEMAKEAQRLEYVEEFKRDEAVSIAVQNYIASLDNEIIYTVTEKVIQAIEFEVVRYLTEEEDEDEEPDIPNDVDETNIQAEFVDGILRITVPKKTIENTKKFIEIN